MRNVFTKGSTGHNVTVALRDSTTGQLKTGVVFGGVTASYNRDGAASATSVTMVSGTLGTFTSGGWVETSTAGLYQFGARKCGICNWRGRGQVQARRIRCDRRLAGIRADRLRPARRGEAGSFRLAERYGRC